MQQDTYIQQALTVKRIDSLSIKNEKGENLHNSML